MLRERFVSAVVVFCVGLLWDLRQSVPCEKGLNVRKRGLKKVWVGGAGLWVVIRATTILCSWNSEFFFC